MSNSSTYNELKLILLEAAKASKRPVQEILDTGLANPDAVELNNLFQVLLNERKEVFEKFRVLFEERQHLFQSLLNLTTASFYVRSINPEISNVYKVFQFLEVLGSPVFENNLLNFISVMRQPNVDDEFLAKATTYFNENLDFLADLYKFAERGYVFVNESGENMVKFNSIKISEYSSPEVLMFYMLNILSGLTEVNVESLMTEIETFPSFIRNMRSKVFNSDSELNSSLRKIVDLLDSFLFIQNKRLQDDNQYFADYSQEIDNSISSIVLFIEGTLSGLNFETIEFLKEGNRMIELNLLYTDLKETFSSLVKNILETIKSLSFIIESYYPYFAINEDFVKQFFQSITDFEDMSFEEEINLAIEEGTDFNIVFSPEFMKRFSTFYSDIRDREEPLIQDDIYNLFLLYSGIIIKEDGFQVGDELVGYSLSSLLRKNLINRNDVSDVIIDIENKAMELAINHSIVVSEIIDNERISSSLKVISREFEKLDLLLFRDLLESQTDDFINDFDKRLYFFILSELLSNKRDLNKNIQLLVKVFEKSKNNFKMIYLEKIIRRVISKMLSINGQLGDLQTVLDDKTLESMRSLENSAQENNELLESYKEVWQFYYNNSESIIQRILKADSELRAYLEEAFYND
jgi:hypothetical protein